MKEIINSLKKTLKITGTKTDAKLAKVLGVTKNTIVRQKRGDKTKLHRVLPMLEHLLSVLDDGYIDTTKEWEIFLEKFKDQNEK